MKELTKYNNIQEMKNDSKAADMSSPRVVERHNSFERSMMSLRQEYVKSNQRQFITMEFSDIIRYICGVLNKHTVEYMIVGGTAVALHGYVRKSTNAAGKVVDKPDLDCWYNPNYKNYFKLLDALEEIGVDVKRYREEQAPDPKRSVFKLEFDEYSLDMLPNIKADLRFRLSFAKRQTIVSEGVEISFLDFEDLIEDKKSLGRPKDLSDIEELEKVKVSE